MVTLGVDIGRDVVGYLAGRVADAHRLVIGGRADPDRTCGGIGNALPPEADVVAPARAVADGLLEGEVLLNGTPYRTADDRDPPVLHVELMNTPVVTEEAYAYSAEESEAEYQRQVEEFARGEETLEESRREL